MRLMLIGVSEYVADFNAWPDEISGLVDLGLLPEDENFFANPQEGFSGYHYEPPEVSPDELDNYTETPILFEVLDDGTVMRKTGVIGYADGHTEFHPEDE